MGSISLAWAALLNEIDWRLKHLNLKWILLQLFIIHLSTVKSILMNTFLNSKSYMVEYNRNCKKLAENAPLVTLYHLLFLTALQLFNELCENGEKNLENVEKMMGLAGQAARRICCWNEWNFFVEVPLWRNRLVRGQTSIWKVNRRYPTTNTGENTGDESRICLKIMMTQCFPNAWSYFPWTNW